MLYGPMNGANSCRKNRPIKSTFLMTERPRHNSTIPRSGGAQPARSDKHASQAPAASCGAIAGSSLESGDAPFAALESLRAVRC